MFALAALLLSLVPAAGPGDDIPELVLSTTHSRGIDFPVVLRGEGLVLSVDTGEVKVWDLETCKTLRTLTFPGVYRGVGRPVHLPDRGWFAVPASDGLYVFRTSDLGLEMQIPEKQLWLSHYDEASQRLVCTSHTQEGVLLHTVDLDKRTLTARTLLRRRSPDAPLSPYVFELLPSGQYLVQFELGQGSALVDPAAWTNVTHLPEENRRILPLGDGDFVAVSTDNKRVEVLDGRTLEVERGADYPADWRALGPLVFQGRTVPRAGERPQLLFVQHQELVQLDAETLTITHKLDGATAFAPRSVAPAGVFPLTPERWLVATWGRLAFIDWRVPAVEFKGATNTFLGGFVDPLPSGIGFHLSNWTSGCLRVECRADDVAVGQVAGRPLRPRYSASGKSVGFVVEGEAAVRVATATEFPRQSRAFDRTEAVPLDKFPELTFSADDTLLAAQGYASTHVYEVATGRLIFELAHATTSTSPYWSRGFCAFSPDGATLAVARVTGDPTKATTRFIEAFDLATRAPRWQRQGALAPLAYTPDGTVLLAVDFERRGLVRLDAATGREVARFDLGVLPGTFFSRWALSADQRCLVVSQGSDVAAIDVADGRVLSRHQVAAKTMQDIDFFASGEHFLTLNDDNLVRLWRVGTDRVLATFTPFGSGDWCLHTPEFLFQASAGAMTDMYFVKGRSFVALESLFEQFFTPGLAPRLFSGEALTPPVEVAKIAAPPMVTLSLEPDTRGLVVEDDLTVVASAVAEVRIAVEATSATEAISEVRLFHNGKLVQSKTRGLVVEDDAEAQRERQSFPLTLLPGENTLKAVALNAQRTESRPAELVIDYRVPTESEGGAAAPQGDAGAGKGLALHLVVVGLNQYRNPRFNLNYAVADATAVRERLRELAGPIFSRVEVHTLFDGDAVKPKIVAKLEEIAELASQRDVFVFYYAGHGVMSSEAQPKFYLVPHDVTQMYGADERLAASALSSVELQELSRRIPAQKQLFVLDACQSAGALDSVAVRGAAEQKAIAQLARSSGTHWLTASGSEQFATEFEALGHGAFTYVLLEGLAGRADSGDGRVTVRELSAFLESEVPEVTQKHKGTMQFPASYSFGQDFPLVLAPN